MKAGACESGAKVAARLDHPTRDSGKKRKRSEAGTSAVAGRNPPRVRSPDAISAAEAEAAGLGPRDERFFQEGSLIPGSFFWFPATRCR